MSATITVGNIEYPNSTSVVTVSFSPAINDTSINSFITIEPSSACSLDTLTTTDSGETWTGTLTGTTGFIVSQAKMTLNYTGGITDSTNFDIIMTSDGKNWNETFSITDNVNTDIGFKCLTANKEGTMFAVDYNAQNYNATNNTFPHVKVYENNNGTWAQKGDNLVVANANKYHKAMLNESGDHIIILEYLTFYQEFAIVYKWDTNISNWVQKGSNITGLYNMWYSKPYISQDGNFLSLFTESETKTKMYEWDTNTSDWVQKGTTITPPAIGNLSGIMGIGKGQVAANLDYTRISFSRGEYIFTYDWNYGTSDWDLIDSFHLDTTNSKLGSMSGIFSHYNGTRIAIQTYDFTTPSTTDYVKVYDWNGTSFQQIGNSMPVPSLSNEYGSGGNSLAFDSTGDKLLTSYKISGFGAHNAKLFHYDGTVWNEINTFTEEESMHVALSGNGDTAIFSNSYTNKSLSVNVNSITRQVNDMSLSLNPIKFPSTTSTLNLVLSHNDLTQTDLDNNTTIVNSSLGTLSSFSSSENGFNWSSTFTASVIDSSTNIDFSYNNMNSSVLLVVDTLEKAISNICFYGTSKVLTNHGYKEIQKLTLNDKINGCSIKNITQTISQEKVIVVIKKNAIANNMPLCDTRITKEHKVLFNGKMIEAYKLVNNNSIVYEPYDGSILYNVLLKDKGKMVVHGMIVETLCPSNNIAKLYNILDGYTDIEKCKIIEIYNQQKRGYNQQKRGNASCKAHF